jgi:Asp-tRNA(Asn)/Glu-tRNA(Gln) amidotransferase A subunit family amidase
LICGENIYVFIRSASVHAARRLSCGDDHAAQADRRAAGESRCTKSRVQSVHPPSQRSGSRALSRHWLDTQDNEALPLFGIPFAIKDNIDLAGIPTTAACPAFAYTPAESATLVAQLISLGAVPLGKANLDQFATGLNGTVHRTASVATACIPTIRRADQARGRR